jgi:hypothetical protein
LVRSTLSNILGCDLLGDASIKARLAQRPALALSRRAGFFDPSPWPAWQQELILGIDIGVQGAVAVLDQSGALEIHDMPTLQDGLPGVNARPGEGPTGAFAFGRARGVIKGS